MRPLYEIARDINRNWPNMYYGARPYVQAMSVMTSINDEYGAEDGETIIMHFLGNAQYWKGEVARRIKTELKNMIGA